MSDFGGMAVRVHGKPTGDLWLVGGASNAGCAVLREQGFEGGELKKLSSTIDMQQPPMYTDYYPLSANTVGERCAPDAHTR